MSDVTRNLLTGKLALVTGGGSGIGRAICTTFAREGAVVVVVDLNQDGAQQTLELLSGITVGSQKHSVVCMDVTITSSVNELFETIQQRYGKPAEVVVNCAGIRGPVKSVVEHSEADFDRVVAVNLKSTFLISQKAISGMLETKVADGSIINFASVATKTGLPRLAGYAAAKAGIVALTKTMAAEVGDKGIRCNVVLPGPIDTPMLYQLLDIPSDRLMALFAAGSQMGRVGQPQEVANVCLFLASSMSSYVNGTVVEVTGGFNS